ncbi:hypothetical protein [Halomarina ordinaria]|uniref:GGDEF domain-containing protein n=1 Tax=Halomarina ordinaria TaxID=3033939 RepID=A0ABD5UBF3_9EURY|nr:hypothetical protein [Halomarina sp. PSRA2]
MGLMLDAARVAAGINVVLLLVLISIWARNYRLVRSRLTLGSMVFAGFLLAENAVALYYYVAGPVMPTAAVRIMMILQLLEVVGISVLVYVTWQ